MFFLLGDSLTAVASTTINVNSQGIRQEAHPYSFMRFRLNLLDTLGGVFYTSLDRKKILINFHEESEFILEGIRVIEVASVVLAPAAAGILADFGSEVITVEVPGGGNIHRVAINFPAYPSQRYPVPSRLKTGTKKSIVLDLKDDEGWQVLRKLVQNADVFVTNYRGSGLKEAANDLYMFSTCKPPAHLFLCFGIW